MNRTNNTGIADGVLPAEEELAKLLGLAEAGEASAEADGSAEVAVDPLDREEQVVRLKACAKRFNRKHVFEAGQLVQWKKGLRNKRTPNYGEPMAVIEVLAEPVFATEQSAGSPYFREPLTLILGAVDKDGDFITFYFDARRFEPYTPAA
jgi:hypothetical protein